MWIPKQKSKEIIRGVWNENYLKRLHETLKHFRHKQKYQRMFLEKSSSVKNESILLSLPLQAPDDQDDKNYQNEMIVQKTIKGRAIQSMLQKGMKKIQNIIQETRETHSIASVRNILPKEFCQEIDCQRDIVTDYMQLEELLRNDSQLQKELKKFESKDVRHLLNYFGNELNRLNTEKQAHALYLLAERERYRREAENFANMSYEKEFKEDSITVYLENILLEGINRAFDENSRNVIREMARNIDKSAEKQVTFDKNDIILHQSINRTEQLKILEVKNNALHREAITTLLKSSMVSQLMQDIKNNELVSLQREYLIKAHHSLYKEEYENFKKEEEFSMCSSIFDEMCKNATAVSFENDLDKEKLLRQKSEDAEFLATKIVEDILNDIIDNEQNYELFKSSDEKVYSKSELENIIIDDDLLAEVVTQDILKNVILNSSLSDLSENGDC